MPELGAHFATIGEFSVCPRCASAIHVLGEGNADYIMAVGAFLKLAKGEYTLDVRQTNTADDEFDCIRDYIESHYYISDHAEAMATVKEFNQLPSTT